MTTPATAAAPEAAPPTYDLAIVGYGPTGMVLAALAGQRGHRVVVLEKHLDLYHLPRAACFDDEIMRTFQKLGLVADIELGAVAQHDYQWVNAAGDTLVDITYPDPATGGWAALYMMYQPHVEGVLDRHCKSLETVEVVQGAAVTAIDEDADGVRVTATARGGGARVVRAKYVVGADGGASFVRRHLDVRSSDYGFAENWLVCDFRKRRPLDDVPTFRQVCDPAQPISIVRIGPDHHRFSFMLDPDETPEMATDPEAVWKRVSGYLRREDAELVRVANYVFRSRMADSWRRGRIMLAGDAAHEMPPFLAQGMCSGMRDSHNLAWKLDLILTNRAAPTILDTYQREREPHVRFITEKAIELGRVQTIRDPELARARDERLLALRREHQEPERLRYPNLVGGLVDESPEAGAFFVQGRVRAGRFQGLMDDVVGQGPCIVVTSPAVLGGLSAAQVAAWERIGGRMVVVTADPPAKADRRLLMATDLDGVYAEWFADKGCVAAVVRPDWYTYGIAADGVALGRLLDDFQEGLLAWPGEVARRGSAA